MESRQHDFVGEVAPSRLSVTRDRRSLDQGYRRSGSSVSPTGSFASGQSLGRSNSLSTMNTAGADALDIEIRFVSAQGLPRMDVVGAGCDPYFRAEIDGVLCYTWVLVKLSINKLALRVIQITGLAQYLEPRMERVLEDP